MEPGQRREPTEKYFPLLNHGYVRYIDHMGSDLRVCQSARVLADAEWRGEADVKLLHFMKMNGHTSPFEHAVFTFEIQCPIFVTRQWHRHRTQSYNEISARYQVMPDLFWIPDAEQIGQQAKKNLQSRDILPLTPEELKTRKGEVLSYENKMKADYDYYQELLEWGWPREVARASLPVGIYTKMFDTANLHNFMHFLDLRLDEHAQEEIRVYADAIFEIVRQTFPICASVWLEHKQLQMEFKKWIKAKKSNSG